MTEKCASVGTDIAKKAKKAKVTTVVFDRNGRQYAGRLKALADAARKEGLSSGMAEQAKNKPHLAPTLDQHVLVAVSKVEVVVAMTDATRCQKHPKNLKK